MRNRPFCGPGNLAVVLLAISAVQGTAHAQQQTVTGRVLSAPGDDPVPSAVVQVAGTQDRTLSDQGGRFSIEVPGPNATLLVSALGFSADTIALNGQQQVTIFLRVAAVALEGVVAVGYGTQQRRDVTGAIGSVTEADLDQVQVPSVAQVLQGRVAGVNVTQSSSAPGGGVSVRIRGSGSIGTTNEPLYVVDGVPISGAETLVPTAGQRIDSNPLSFLNPDDIASIEVLKDASSTAIYGARGTNGVVLITTRRGTAGSSRMEFESSVAIQRAANRLHVLNAEEFARYANDYLRIDWGDTLTVPFADPSALGTGVDWQDVVMQDAPMHEHQVSILGGSEQTRFAISGNYADQEGVVRSSEFERFGLRANVQHDVNRWLRVGTNVNVSRVNQSVGYTEGGSDNRGASALTAAVNYLPLVPVFHENGDYTRGTDVPAELAGRFNVEGSLYDNPLAIIEETTDLAENDRLLGNLFAEVDLLAGMTLRLNGAATVMNNARNEYFTSNTQRGEAPNNGVARLNVVEQSHYLGESIVNYRRSFGDLHRLDLTAGTTIETQNRFQRILENRNFSSDRNQFYDIGAGTPVSGPSVGSSYSDWTLLSYLGRANYSLADKYLLTLTGRADGSSKFGADNKWAYFPSAAVAWRLSEEPLLQRAGWLSDLKLRLSYGLTGNQEIGNYQSLSRWNEANYNFAGTLLSGFEPVSIGNPNLRWEKSRQLDMGFDAGFWNNRVSMSFDVYEKTTEDLLLDVPLPFETGFTSALQNLGSIRNRGVELAVGADILDGDAGGLGWRTSLNLSRNRNRVLELGDREEFLGNNFSGGVQLPGLLVREGLPLGVFFGYQTNGIFQTQADLDAHVGPDGEPIQPGAVLGEQRYVDTNGDGTIGEDDRVVLGDPAADVALGWTNNLTYGAFNLYGFLQGTFGNDVYNANMKELSRGSLAENIYAPSYLDAWSPENPNGRWPVINNPPGVGYRGSGNQRGEFNDQFLFDGSYLRLRSLTVSYDLPERLANQVGGMQSARIYMSGENLYTWTKDYDGFNPDVNTAGRNNINRGIDFGGYPLAKTYRVGIRFGL